MKRTKKKCQMLLAGLLTLMMVFTMWSPSAVYATEAEDYEDEVVSYTTDTDEVNFDSPRIIEALQNGNYDTNNDGKFSYGELKAVEELTVTYELNDSSDNFSLSGMEALVNLESFSFGLDLNTDIEAKYLHNEQLTNIDALSKLENLKSVRFRGVIIDDFSGLSNNIETLYFPQCQYGDISALTKLTSLKVLSIAHSMPITMEVNSVLTIISGLANLETLYLINTGISDISALSGMTNLKNLELSFNCITDFSPIRELEKNGTNVNKKNQKVSLTGSTMIDGVETSVTMKVVEDVYNTLSSAQQTAIDKVLNADSQEDMQKELIKDTAGVSVSAVKYYKLLDISLPSGTDISAGAVITLKDDSVKAGMNIIMLHLKADGTWENIPVTVADGEIKGTFTSLSPVYYFAVEGSTDSGSGENTGSVSVSTKYEPAEITFTGNNGKAMRWISSEKDGNISISGLQTVIADGAKFYAEKVKSTAIANAVAEAKGDVPYVAYDFTLTVDGEEVTKFAEHVDVSMPVPDGFDLGEGQTVTVYYYNNGKLEKCNTAVSDGFVTFGTTHFSTFVYIQESAASAASTPAVSYTVSPKTGENDMVLYMAVLAVAVGGMVYCLNKRRSY